MRRSPVHYQALTTSSQPGDTVGRMTVHATRRTRIFALLLAVTALAGCGQARTDSDASGTRPLPSTSPTTTTTAPHAPPVGYQPSVPGRTRMTALGYQVNTCVPAEHDPATFTLTTADGVHLPAIELGTGDRGVLLAHEQGYNICSWLSLGEELADAGFHVMLFEYRNHGASERTTSNTHIDRDASAALAELHRRGADRVLIAGASCGGTSSAVVAATEPRLAGLLLLSSPAHCLGEDGETAVRSITRPSLFAVSPNDYSGNMIKEVRTLYAASAAGDKHLEIVPGGRHGTDMLRYNRPERLHRLVRDFIDSAFRS